MRDAYLAALAVIAAAMLAYAWAAPESQPGAFASEPRRSNCPPRRHYASQSPRPAAPEYPQTSTRGNVTTALRRSD